MHVSSLHVAIESFPRFLAANYLPSSHHLRVCSVCVRVLRASFTHQVVSFIHAKVQQRSGLLKCLIHFCFFLVDHPYVHIGSCILSGTSSESKTVGGHQDGMLYIINNKSSV